MQVSWFKSTWFSVFLGGEEEEEDGCRYGKTFPFPNYVFNAFFHSLFVS